MTREGVVHGGREERGLEGVYTKVGNKIGEPLGEVVGQVLLDLLHHVVPDLRYQAHGLGLHQLALGEPYIRISWTASICEEGEGGKENAPIW